MVIGTTQTSAPIRSVLAGASQQVGANTIVNPLTTIAGAPSNLSITNPLATAGAADPETDAELRDRAQRFFSTVQRGTLTAIEQAARNVPGVRYARAFEDVDNAGRQSGYVSLVITDQYTASLAQLGTVPPTYETQSQQLAVAVTTAVEQARAAGVFVQVIVAQVILQPVTLLLRFQAGVDQEAVAVAARAACVQVINRLAPGETLTVAALQEALSQVPGLQYTGDEVSLPIGDVVPTPLQVLRTNLGLVILGG
jgi:uncharacterized phage protein gp47/JayE